MRPNRYPANWDEIRAGVLRRAEMRCECVGECGVDYYTHAPARCREEHGALAKFGRGVIVLTVDPDIRLAYCPRCHERRDAKAAPPRTEEIEQGSLF